MKQKILMITLHDCIPFFPTHILYRSTNHMVSSALRNDSPLHSRIGEMFHMPSGIISPYQHTPFFTNEKDSITSLIADVKHTLAFDPRTNHDHLQGLRYRYSSNTHDTRLHSSITESINFFSTVSTISRLRECTIRWVHHAE